MSDQHADDYVDARRRFVAAVAVRDQLEAELALSDAKTAVAELGADEFYDAVVAWGLES